MKYPYVMIAIPIKNNAIFMQSLYDNITKLEYPKNKITLCILESDSDDNTWNILQTWQSVGLLDKYRKVHIWKHTFNFKLPYFRRQINNQEERYRILGIVRTEVITKFLKDEEWIFAFDADLKWIPPASIKRGISLGEDIISFLAFFNGGDGLRAFNIIWNNQTYPSNHPIKDCMHIAEITKDLPEVMEIPLLSTTAFFSKSKLFKEHVNFLHNKGEEGNQEQGIISNRLKEQGYKIYLDIKNIVIHW